MSCENLWTGHPAQAIFRAAVGNLDEDVDNLDVEKLKDLLEERASELPGLINLPDEDGFGAMHHKCMPNGTEDQSVKIIKLLVKHGACIDCKTKSTGETPLMLAAHYLSSQSGRSLAQRWCAHRH